MTTPPQNSSTPNRRPKAISPDHQAEIIYYVEHGRSVPLWVHLLYSLAIDTGLRLPELLCLPFGLFWQDGKLRRTLLVDDRVRQRHGTMPFEVHLPNRTLALIQQAANRAAERGLFGAEEMLFVANRGAGHISAATASRALKRMFLAALGVDHGYRSRSLRLTKLSNMYRGGATVAMLHAVMGHKSVSTTARYLKS